MKFQSIFVVLSCIDYTSGDPGNANTSLMNSTAHDEVPLGSGSSGGISFTLPPDIASSISGFLAENNTCPTLGASHKRVPEDIVECLYADAQDIIDAMGLNGPLAGLFNQIQTGAIAIPAQTETFADEGTVQALSLTMSYASDTLPDLQTGISGDTIEIVAFTAFCIVFYFVFINAANLASIAISQSFLTHNGSNCIVGWKPPCDDGLCAGQNGICTGTTYFKGCPCDNNACPAPEEDGLICTIDCGGADPTGKCFGDTDGDFRGCDCIDPWDLPFYNADDHAYQDISGILAALPASSGTFCTASGGHYWTYGPAVELYAKEFCANSSNLAGYFGDQIVYTFDPTTEDSTTFAITFLSSTSENVVLSQADCYSNFWSILNCPRVGTNAYGGNTQLPSGGPILEIIPNAGPPNVTCDPPDPPLLPGQPPSYKVALNRDGIVAAYTDFCRGYADESLRSRPQPIEVYGPLGGPWVSGHQNIRLIASKMQTYDPNGFNYCASATLTFDGPTCLKVFAALTDGCDAGTTTGKRGGSSNYACMKYIMSGTFSTADIFRLHIHQQMVDTFSQIQWTMYDSRGTIMGGPSTSSTATGAPQDVGFHVDNPTNKDNTNVRMFYPNGGKFQWSTGWTGKANSNSYYKEYYCDDVLSGGAAGWTGWQSNGRNGFERQFDCYFRGWGDNDGDLLT